MSVELYCESRVSSTAIKKDSMSTRVGRVKKEKKQIHKKNLGHRLDRRRVTRRTTANHKLHFNAVSSMETGAYLANAEPLTREAAASGLCVCADLSGGRVGRRGGGGGLVRDFHSERWRSRDIPGIDLKLVLSNLMITSRPKPP